MQTKQTCQQHRSDVFGKTDMKELAEEICNLRYDTLAELMHEMHLKMLRDAVKDKYGGRKKLSDILYSCSTCFDAAFKHLKEAWEISKKFM